MAAREWDTMHSQTYTFPQVDEAYKETLGAKRMRNQVPSHQNGKKIFTENRGKSSQRTGKITVYIDRESSEE